MQVFRAQRRNRSPGKRTNTVGGRVRLRQRSSAPWGGGASGQCGNYLRIDHCPFSQAVPTLLSDVANVSRRKEAWPDLANYPDHSAITPGCGSASVMTARMFASPLELLTSLELARIRESWGARPCFCYLREASLAAPIDAVELADLLCHISPEWCTVQRGSSLSLL